MEKKLNFKNSRIQIDFHKILMKINIQLRQLIYLQEELLKLLEHYVKRIKEELRFWEVKEKIHMGT